MRAYGFSRTKCKCKVYRAGNGKKIRFSIFVKNRKAERQNKDAQ